MSSVKPFSFDDNETPYDEHDGGNAQPPAAPQPASVNTASSSVTAAPLPQQASSPPPPQADFSKQFEPLPPAEVFSRLAIYAEQQRGAGEFDVYGSDSLLLDAFEDEVARMLGCKEGVFFLTGTMAQQIAIELHRADTRSPVVAAHPSAHPVHLTSLDNGVEQERAFAQLAAQNLPGASVRAVGAIHRTLSHADVAEFFGAQQKQWFSALQQEHVDFARAVAEAKEKAGTFGNLFGANPEEGLKKPAPLPDPESFRLPGLMLIELPQRFNGGATMSLADLVKVRATTKARGMRLHLDGARLWDVAEAFACPLKEVCSHFDSVYVSFYKGIGAMGGAMLLGDADFCARARALRHQRGGAAFTMLPYALHAQMCLRENLTTFGTRLDTCRAMVGLVKAVAALVAADAQDHECEQLVRFEPRVPQSSMVHCYLFAPKAHIDRAHAAATAATGCRLFNRLRGRGYLPDSEPQPPSVSKEAWYFEWSFGTKNGAIDAEFVMEPWRVFLEHLVKLRQGGASVETKQPGGKGKK